MACGIYLSIAGALFDTDEIAMAVHQGVLSAKAYYENNYVFSEELKHFSRLLGSDFADLPECEIKSGGYVVDTLEAAVWCLQNTESYADCVLTAVNLGGDTDTTAAVAGGLAGIFYGFAAIPCKWVDSLQNKDYLLDIYERFAVFASTS